MSDKKRLEDASAKDGQRYFSVLGKVLLPICIIQLAFWFVYYPFFVKGPSPAAPLGTPYEFSEGGMQSPDYGDLDVSSLSAIKDLRGSYCCEKGYRAVRFLIDLNEVPAAGAKMPKSVSADNYRLYVNGDLAFSRGRMEIGNLTYHSNVSPVVWISPGLLKEGPNEFLYISARDSVPWHDLKGGWLFDAAEFDSKHAKREFILSEFKWIEFGFSIIVFVIAAVILARAQNRSEPFWLFAIAFFWMLTLAYYIWWDPIFSGESRLYFYFFSKAGLIAAWLGWVNAWAARKNKHVTNFIAALSCAWLITLAGGLVVLPFGQDYNFAALILNVGGTFFGVLILVRLSAGGIEHLQDKKWEAAFVSLLAVFLIFQSYNELVYAKNPGLLSMGYPVLIGGLIAGFLARNFTLFQSQQQLTSQLEIQLAAKTKALDSYHKREIDIVRERAHMDERKRIMQDMHDGLGSTLTSLLLSARQRKGTPEKFEAGLQSVIDEMRLIINSMDSVGGSLGAALSAFRERTEDRVVEAGMDFLWIDDTSLAHPVLGPRKVLDVFRILQEAVTNALKHSSGNHLKVSLKNSSEGSLIIEVVDNGTSNKATSGDGNGLLNMQSRASRIGAQLEINEASNGGFIVSLAIPSIELSE